MEAGSKDRPLMLAPGSPITTTERIHETYKNVSQEIRDQLNAKAKAVQIILTGIDNDIYSTVYACPNACEMWKAIKRGKAIINSSQPIYDQEPSMVAEDDETSKDKEIDKLMALISLSFKKIYKPTKNNLRTSSNTSRSNEDNSPRINKSVGYENQRIANVVGARETVGSSVEEAGIQLNAKQADWRDDTNDDELEDQELEAHYMYMAQLQKVSRDAADSGPIFDDKPLQKVSNDDHYNVFAIDSAHPEQSKSIHDTYPIEQDAQNVIIDSLDMNYNKEEINQNDDDDDLAIERELLASLIKKLKCEIDESKNRNKFLETSNKVLIEKLKGSSVTTTETYMETYKNVSQDIPDQLNAEAKVVQIILTGIDNDIYSTVDACPNACEMWKAIERFYKMMNELIRNQCDVTNHQVNVQFLLQLQPEWQRAERIARTTNLFALVAQQQPVYHPQNHPTHYTQNSSTRSQQAATMNRGKAIINSSQPIYDQEPFMVAEDEEMSKDKEIDKLMALISPSFKKIYKPTNNNLRTSSITSRANQDNSPRINRSTGIKIKGLEFGHVARECQKPKRVKDAGYHREKMLLCKQEEAGIQLNAEQADWRDDIDDELEDQELEAHYMYMAQIQEVSPDVADFGPIFDAEPLQKVSNDDHYNVFAIESEHPEQSESVHDTYPIEQDEHNVIIDSLDMSYDREQINQNDDDDDDLANKRELLASLIEKLKCKIDDSKNRNKFLETSNKVLIENLKETNKLLYNDFKKSQAELTRRNDMEYVSKVEIDCAKAKGDLISYKMES
nr:hypothetical protein [Tanacetum cinerariifolium]